MKWLLIAPLTAALVLAVGQGASAALLAVSATTDYSGEGDYWDTIPNSPNGSPTFRVYDYEADGYGVRLRSRDQWGLTSYVDQTAGADTIRDYNASPYEIAIQACNRDALSGGTIRVFNCDSWVYV
ncbi:hypothetical protein ABGB18_46065 [Nonomuraea sp. B12E4]|uniref:hypothetical protein n=1 Tax=Nonomuraea sp. B12E4 TaxID=3153564 RepID=UPI00325C9D84